MHSKEQLKKISETYFQALRDKDFNAIPFSDDIVFRAPLTPGGSGNPIKGKNELFEKWWKPLEPALDGAQIKIIDHYYNDSLTEIISDITAYPASIPQNLSNKYFLHHLMAMNSYVSALHNLQSCQ